MNNDLTAMALVAFSALLLVCLTTIYIFDEDLKFKRELMLDNKECGCSDNAEG